MIPGDFQRPPLDKKKLALFAVLGGGGFAAFVGVVLVTVWIISAWLGRPIIFGYTEGPEQPIAFPHTVHAGVAPLLDADGDVRTDDEGQTMHGLGLDCTFCHRNVTQGAAATIPAMALCMTCHTSVGDGIPEVEKLRQVSENGQSIDWVRVHRVPDHVHFVHEAHIRFFMERDGVVAAAVCSTCHGEVSEMTRVKQVRSLKMGDCVDCHRDNGAPTDCTTCHY